MGSSHFGELGLGGGKSGSIRKGRKSNSEKPKQPQRGLGVARLEEIRLQNQMAGHHPSLRSPFHSNLNKDEDVRVELAFSPSPPSSSNSASSSSLYALHPNIVMSFGEAERADNGYRELQSCSTTRRSLMNHDDVFRPQLVQQRETLPLLEQYMEGPMQRRRHHDRRYSTGSMRQNSDLSDTQELDLDLKLSL